MDTNFYFFFGRVDVTMKPAPGQGIISSIVLESDDLDEVDWEFLGGVDNQVQTNFFGKGDTSSYDRMIQYGVDSAQEVYHTYSLDWTAERIQWIIDGTVVRELKYTDSVALNGKVSTPGKPNNVNSPLTNNRPSPKPPCASSSAAGPLAPRVTLKAPYPGPAARRTSTKVPSTCTSRT